MRDAKNVAQCVVNSARFFCVRTYDRTKHRLWSRVGEDRMRATVIELSALADEFIGAVKISNILR